MALPVNPNFKKDQTNDAGTLITHDMVIPDPFSLKTVNIFNSSPPFGLIDIFNHIIYLSTDYDKQGLTACYCPTCEKTRFNDKFFLRRVFCSNLKRTCRFAFFFLEKCMRPEIQICNDELYS